MQKFHKGDWVKVADDLGHFMSHFTAGCEAIVIGSYEDQYGGRHDPDGNPISYTLYLKDHGKVSWYYEGQLELIEAGRHDLLAQWESDLEAKETQESDLDWIFAHGERVLKGASGSTAKALAECFGPCNLWGAHGEGLAYYENTKFVLQIAEPFLRAGNKAGWLELAEKRKGELSKALVDVCVYGEDCEKTGHRLHTGAMTAQRDRRKK